jgi:phospho-N-acetylmuramoyl-pentapeptide-transferase
MILLKLEILLIILALVFVIETLSVILQVIYFKKTKGKRLFLMSPIHHHFELKGYSEWQVDIMFWLIAIVAAIITLTVAL